MLIDHVQEFESAAVSFEMDLEIDSPHLLGMLSPLTPHRAIGGPCPLSLRRCGSLQPLLSPEPLHSFFSPSSLRDATGGKPSAGPCRYVQLRSRGADVAPLHFSSETILAGLRWVLLF